MKSQILPASRPSRGNIYHPDIVLLRNDRWLRNISTKIRRPLKQRSVFYFQFCLFRQLAKIAAVTMSRQHSAR